MQMTLSSPSMPTLHAGRMEDIWRRKRQRRKKWPSRETSIQSNPRIGIYYSRPNKHQALSMEGTEKEDFLSDELLSPRIVQKWNWYNSGKACVPGLYIKKVALNCEGENTVALITDKPFFCPFEPPFNTFLRRFYNSELWRGIKGEKTRKLNVQKVNCQVKIIFKLHLETILWDPALFIQIKRRKSCLLSENL